MSYFAYCYETYRQIRKIPMLQSTQIKLIICDFNDFVYDRKLLALPAKKSNPLPTQPPPTWVLVPLRAMGLHSMKCVNCS